MVIVDVISVFFAYHGSDMMNVDTSLISDKKKGDLESHVHYCDPALLL